MNPENLEQLLALLNKEAASKHCYDKWEDYSPCDNGNFDDAWEDGDNHGRATLARELLTLLGQPMPELLS